MIRQGDVILISEAIPDGAIEVKSGDQIVLAEGEVTGHSHSLGSQHATLLMRGVVAYLLVHKATELFHGHAEEHQQGDHDPLVVPPGTYHVSIERDYYPGGWRRVVD